MATNTLTILITPGGNSSPALEFINLILKQLFDNIDLPRGALNDAIEFGFGRFVIDSDFTPIRHWQLIEILFR